MKNRRKILVLLCIAIACSGCSAAPKETEQLFRPDTVVNIPLNPEVTEVTPETEEQTVPEETAAETERPTEETQAPAKTTTSTKSTTTKSTSSSKTSGSKNTTKATEPIETQPPVTEAPETQPSQTEIPETQLTAMEAAEADSSGTETVETDPPETEAAETEPSETETADTEPPEAEETETEPPETQSPEAAIYDISDYVAGGLEYGVVDQINACRTEEGLEPLSMSGTLCGIASVRAYEVCLSWSHTRPNGSEWQSVLSDYGYGYGAAEEDLVHTAGFDAASIVSKWMDSDSSRADILSADFTTIGVGVYSVDGTVFLAAIFVG